jgi:inosine-uridine nucleoside N-ribohydrolase
VLSSGIEVALIPLDVTTQVALIEPDLARMSQLDQFAELAARSCAYISQRDSEIIPHDAVAAVAMACPDFFGWDERR